MGDLNRAVVNDNLELVRDLLSAPNLTLEDVDDVDKFGRTTMMATTRRQFFDGARTREILKMIWNKYKELCTVDELRDKLLDQKDCLKRWNVMTYIGSKPRCHENIRQMMEFIRELFDKSEFMTVVYPSIHQGALHKEGAQWEFYLNFDFHVRALIGKKRPVPCDDLDEIPVDMYPVSDEPNTKRRKIGATTPPGVPNVILVPSNVPEEVQMLQKELKSAQDEIKRLKKKLMSAGRKSVRTAPLTTVVDPVDLSHCCNTSWVS